MTSVTNEVKAAADRLRSDRRPFVAATVVRAERPTSAKAGDTALVFEDGTVVGFVGGECAQTSVQAQALAVLESGEPVLLRIRPDAPEIADAKPDAGAVTVHNPCLSGGALEIFLEPEVPPPLVVVHGDAPIARAVRELAEWMGYDVRPSGDTSADDVDAVVVASHGGEEHEVLRTALDAGVSYIGLVASQKRGSAVLDALGLSAEERERITTPAGLDIGSRSPQEAAVSILAEAVMHLPRAPRRRDHHPETVSGDVPVATDPVCGMRVAMIESSRHADHAGVRYWFCGSGCEQAFRADPNAFVGS